MEDKHPSLGRLILDYTIKCVAILLPVIIGIWQFYEQQEQQSIMEFERMIRQQKMEVYKRTTETVGRIVSSINKDEKEFNRGVSEFTAIYWGELILVEDTSITPELIDFKHQVSGLNWRVSDVDSAKAITHSADALNMSIRAAFLDHLNKLTE